MTQIRQKHTRLTFTLQTPTLEKMEKLSRRMAGQLVHDVNLTKTYETNAYLTDPNFGKKPDSRPST